jgi:hypothetical protein
MSKYIFYIVMLGLVMAGCVERRLMILSDPPGAQVIIDGKRIGETPNEAYFYFYGSREITLYKKGYCTLSRLETIMPPLYQTFPLDFFFEICWPFTIQDEHRMEYTLKPQLPLEPEQRESLEKRANLLRDKGSVKK